MIVVLLHLCVSVSFCYLPCAYLYDWFVLIYCIQPSPAPSSITSLCPSPPHCALCQTRTAIMTMVLTCKTLFPLVLMMPNLQTLLWWMESDLTVLLNPLNPLGQPMPVPLSSDWEAMVVISSPLLTQNLVLNMNFLNLQGSF